MKYFKLILLLLLWTNFSFSQSKDLLFISKKQDDSLSIRWIPQSQKILHYLLSEKITISYKKSTNIGDTIISSNDLKKEWQVDVAKILSVKELSMLEPFTQYDPSFETSSVNEIFGYAIIFQAIDKQIAKALGNTLIVSKAKNVDFLFVKIEIPSKSLSFSQMITPEINKETKIEFTKIQPDGKKTIFMQWDAEKYKNLISFNVYRSEDNKKFIKLNENPMLFSKNKDLKAKQYLHYSDTLLQKGKTYYYQIRGTDYFTDEIALSDIKKMYIKKTVDAIPHIDSVVMATTNNIIKISIKKESTLLPDLAQLILLSSSKIDTGYAAIKTLKILKLEDKYEFEFPSTNEYQELFFKVAAISSDKDTVYSSPYYFFTLDQNPPEPITKLEYKIDSTGIVKISWLAPKDKDIQGYRVFQSNSKNAAEYIEKTTRLSTNQYFIDTLNLRNLTSLAYYYVKVVDNNFNNSIPSDTITVVKPDTIKPIAPSIKDYTSDKNGIQIKWLNSNSEDLKIQYLIRTNVQSGHKDTLMSWSTDIRHFLDTNVYSGSAYNYSLIAYDLSNNASDLDDITVSYELGYRTAINTLKGIADRKNKEIDLTWTYEKLDEVYSFQIYKSKENGKFSIYKTIVVEPGTKLEFSDKQVTINSKFKYKIKAVLNSGISTKLSKEIIVEY